MLLGSPPDMIRGYPLRETGSAAHGGGQVRAVYFTTILCRWQLFSARFFRAFQTVFRLFLRSALVDYSMERIRMLWKSGRRREKRRPVSAAVFSVKGERNTMGRYPFG